MNLWTDRIVNALRVMLSSAKDCGPIDSTEIFVRSRKTFTAGINLRQELSSEQSKLESAIIRLHGQGKVGAAMTTSFEADDLKQLVQHAVETFKKSEERTELLFPEFKYSGPNQSYLDDTFLLVPNEEKSERLLNLSNHLKTISLGDEFKVQGQYREDHWTESLWVSGADRPLSWEKCVGSLQAEAFLEKSGQIFKGTSEISDTVYYGMDWPRVIREAAIQAQSISGQVPPVAGRQRMLFAPQVAARLMWYVGQALRGDLIASELSFFAAPKAYRWGESVVSNSELTLVDDPLYKKSVGLALWDSEGYPTQRLEMISQGVLKAMPQNYKSSLALKLPRTGHAVRTWGQVEPIVGAHNLCVEPGKRDYVDLIRAMGSGLLVEGIDTVESVHLPTGEFTLGCVGYRVDNGLEGEAVGKFFIRGRLQDLLKNVVGVGRDIRWYGRVASGSLLCDDILVIS